MIDLGSCRTRRALLGYSTQPHAYLGGASRRVRTKPN
jgi:hypothetical protein